MTVKFNSKKEKYTIYNKKESHGNMAFSGSFCKMYFNNFGIDVYRNKEQKKVILVLTNSSGLNTSKFHVMSSENWNSWKNEIEHFNSVSSLDATIQRFFEI